jgi:hypothetical protein
MQFLEDKARKRVSTQKKDVETIVFVRWHSMSSSMFNNINNIEINGGVFTMENHMVSTVSTFLACDPH